MILSLKRETQGDSMRLQAVNHHNSRFFLLSSGPGAGNRLHASEQTPQMQLVRRGLARD